MCFQSMQELNQTKVLNCMQAQKNITLSLSTSQMCELSTKEKRKKLDYLLRPHKSVFQALVRAGSTCQEAPDLWGPIMSHLNGGRLSLSKTSKKSS